MLAITWCRIFLSFSLRLKKVKLYKTINLPVVSYGYETCSLSLREVRRLRVFEYRLLRRIFGPKMDR